MHTRWFRICLCAGGRSCAAVWHPHLLQPFRQFSSADRSQYYRATELWWGSYNFDNCCNIWRVGQTRNIFFRTALCIPNTLSVGVFSPASDCLTSIFPSTNVKSKHQHVGPSDPPGKTLMVTTLSARHPALSGGSAATPCYSLSVKTHWYSGQLYL